MKQEDKNIIKIMLSQIQRTSSNMVGSLNQHNNIENLIENINKLMEKS